MSVAMKTHDLTLGFLRSLNPSTLSDHGVLIVGTYRKDEADEALWKLAARPGVRSVELARLDRATVAQIARDMLALSDPPDALIDRLVAQPSPRGDRPRVAVWHNAKSLRRSWFDRAGSLEFEGRALPSPHRDQDRPGPPSPLSRYRGWSQTS